MTSAYQGHGSDITMGKRTLEAEHQLALFIKKVYLEAVKKIQVCPPN